MEGPGGDVAPARRETGQGATGYRIPEVCADRPPPAQPGRKTDPPGQPQTRSRISSIEWLKGPQPPMSSPMSSETATPPAPAAPTGATTSALTSPAEVTFTGRDGKGILITEPAMKQLAVLMAQQGSDKLLRVGVRSGGCSGMSYTMDFIDAAAIASDDEEYVYEPAGAPSFRVVSDPKSLLYIYGMQLDFSSALIGGGFNFTNPNATQTCGCGSSFAV